MTPSPHRLIVGLAIVAVTFVSLAIIGAVEAYSPVPFWDMWSGYLEFFIDATSGAHPSIWWSQHNEHRIVLARLLFWIDLKWFGGAVWFLIVVNYILLALIVTAFWFCAREAAPQGSLALNLVLLIWLTSWAQHENLTWGFQSQFLLAQLLPLLALIALQRSIKSHHSTISFWTACLLGVMATGTMANGVLALPVMLLFALAVKMRWGRIAILAVLSALALALYFHNYTSPAKHHSSLLAALVGSPGDLALYVLLYLGSPLYHIASSRVVAAVGGAVLIALAIHLFLVQINRAKPEPLVLAMLGFILFVMGTAVGTGGGRLFLGTDQALSSRYTTPALMAWAALFVAIHPKIQQAAASRRGSRAIMVGVGGAIIAMLPLQFRALADAGPQRFEKMLAALALEMQVLDHSQIRRVAEDPPLALEIAKKAGERGLSVFAFPVLKGVQQQLGAPAPARAASSRLCGGFLDEATPLAGNTHHARVRGWIFDPLTRSVPRSVWLTSASGTIIGYALVGQRRPDVAAAVDRAALESGFTGYIDSTSVADALHDADFRCRVTLSHRTDGRT